MSECNGLVKYLVVMFSNSFLEMQMVTLLGGCQEKGL